MTDPQRTLIAVLLGHQNSFLGANMDAVAVGQSLGSDAAKTTTYAPLPAGVDAAFMAAGQYVSRRRSAPVGQAVAGFSDDDRLSALAGKG